MFFCFGYLPSLTRGEGYCRSVFFCIGVVRRNRRLTSFISDSCLVQRNEKDITRFSFPTLSLQEYKGFA